MPMIASARWRERLARDERGKLRYHAVDFARLDLREGKGVPRVGGLAWGVPFTLRLRGHANRYKAKERPRGFELEIGSSIAFEEADELLLPTGELWTPEAGLLKTTLTLDARPAQNSWAFDLDFPPGTEFAWQPPLSAEEAALGFLRPDWAAGSYAVLDAAGCKIAHIPRPFARDADGNWTWCSVQVAGAVLTVAVPSAWLDAARYPVVIDPTFGYTTIGASTGGWAGNYLGANGTYSPAADGTTDAVVLYCYRSPASSITAGLYDTSSGYPNAKVVDTAAATQPASFQWFTMPTDSAAPVYASTSYWIAAGSDNGIGLTYDITTKSVKYLAWTYVPGTLPSTFPGGSPDYTYTYSMYVTYTEGGARKTPWHLFFGRGA